MSKEATLFCLSDTLVVIMYEQSYRDRSFIVEAEMGAGKNMKYKVVDVNEVFCLNEKTGQFYISKISKEGAILPPYVIYYNIREIDPEELKKL